MQMACQSSRVKGARFLPYPAVFRVSFVPMTPRIEAALKALSGSVLVALVVPAAIEGGVEFVAAVVVAAVVTAASSRPLIGMIAGVSVAALMRMVS